MSSRSVTKLFYGDKTAICKFCGERYPIHESTAWDVAIYCDGECECLDEENDEENE